MFLGRALHTHDLVPFSEQVFKVGQAGQMDSCALPVGFPEEVRGAAIHPRL